MSAIIHIGLLDKFTFIAGISITRLKITATAITTKADAIGIGSSFVSKRAGAQIYLFG
jgi:hypothetical protein